MDDGFQQPNHRDGLYAFDVAATLGQLGIGSIGHAQPGFAPSWPMAAGAALWRKLGLSALDEKLLRCASNGFVDKEIAQELNMKPSRVHQRWRILRRTLGAKDRSHAVAIALGLGLISAPEVAVSLMQGL